MGISDQLQIVNYEITDAKFPLFPSCYLHLPFQFHIGKALVKETCLLIRHCSAFQPVHGLLESDVGNDAS